MKIYGSIKELVALLFRRDGQEITVEPNNSTTYTANRVVQLPPGDTAHVIVSETATQTLTNKTLTAPVISSPTGITKADVGLGNVDNTSDATKNSAVATLTNKTISDTDNTITDLVFATAMAPFSSADLAGKLSDETGSGLAVFATSPTLVTPALGTPSTLVLTNATGLPLATGLNAFTSAELAGRLTDETGTGAAVFAASPVLTTPALGTPSSLVLTNATGLPLATGVNTFSSADLLGRLTDETGSGANVFGTGPTLSTPVIQDNVIFTEGGTPATPSAGFLRLYAKTTDEKLYTLNNAGIETQVGSGSSSGGINYISNADFEATANGVLPAGWLGYTDAASSTPVDGTGGTSPPTGVTFLASTTSPLRGTKSVVLTKDAANRQGAGYSYDFTSSSVDQNKKLAIRVDLQVSSGTYAQGDLAFYIYDVTNAVLITPSVASIPSTTTASHWEVSFDSRASNSYRLILHVASTSAVAYSVKFDTFSVDPGVLGQVPAVGDWQSYTPAISNATGTVTGMWKRSGDTMQIKGRLVLNAAATGAVKINIPSGFTADSTKYPGGQTNFFYGTAEFLDSSANQGYVGSPFLATTTSVGFYGHAAADWNATVPVATASGDTITFEVFVPIAEWASSGVNIGAGAQVEYVSYYDAGDAQTVAGNVYNTAANVSRNQLGSRFNSINSTNTNGNVTAFQMNWQTPRQAGDKVWLEVFNASSGWTEIGSNGGPVYSVLQQIVTAGTNEKVYGMGYTANVGSTLATVIFGNSGRVTNGVGYGALGATFASIANSANFMWRLCKANPSSPVGFGLATATDSGLISSQESGVLTIPTTGPIAQNITVNYSRVGKQVTLQVEQTASFLSAATASIVSAAGALPSSLRPAAGNATIIPVSIYQQGGVNTDLYYLSPANDGSITILRGPGLAGWVSGQSYILRKGASTYLVP